MTQAKADNHQPAGFTASANSSPSRSASTRAALNPCAVRTPDGPPSRRVVTSDRVAANSRKESLLRSSVNHQATPAAPQHPTDFTETHRTRRRVDVGKDVADDDDVEGIVFKRQRVHGAVNVSISAPSRVATSAAATTTVSRSSTAEARPVRPVFAPSCAISIGSLQPSTSRRSPSLTPGHRDGQRFTGSISSTATRTSKLVDDIVPGCEKSAKN